MRAVSTRTAGSHVSVCQVRGSTDPPSPVVSPSATPSPRPPTPSTRALPSTVTDPWPTSHAVRDRAVASSTSAWPASSSARGRSTEEIAKPEVSRARVVIDIAWKPETRSPPAAIIMSRAASLSPIRSPASLPIEP